MPVNYGILRGSIINSIPYIQGSDHYQIEIKAAQLYRIAVDVYSQFAGTTIQFAPDGQHILDINRMVMFYKDENFQHPLLQTLLQLKLVLRPKVNYRRNYALIICELLLPFFLLI